MQQSGYTIIAPISNDHRTLPETTGKVLIQEKAELKTNDDYRFFNQHSIMVY